MLKSSFITTLLMLSVSYLVLAAGGDHEGPVGGQRQQAEVGGATPSVSFVNGQCQVGRPGTQSAISQAPVRDQEAAAFLQQLCIGCHQAKGRGPQAVAGLRNGGAAAVNSGRMPEGATLDANQKAQVLQALSKL